MALAVTYLCVIQNRDAALRITSVYSSASSGANTETVPGKCRSLFFSMEQNPKALVLDIEAAKRINGKYINIKGRKPGNMSSFAKLDIPYRTLQTRSEKSSRIPDSHPGPPGIETDREI
ncbi:hypothetical protein F5Y11DRAFT_338009 [Daldinia sp. FL1419]|nr:hypothetical protein F5Y11DRAFT_338009 [Daldinia sp. FL1419]